jgi:hypothetical protein
MRNEETFLLKHAGQNNEKQSRQCKRQCQDQQNDGQGGFHVVPAYENTVLRMEGHFHQGTNQASQEKHCYQNVKRPTSHSGERPGGRLKVLVLELRSCAVAFLYALCNPILQAEITVFKSKRSYSCFGSFSQHNYTWHTWQGNAAALLETEELVGLMPW